MANEVLKGIAQDLAEVEPAIAEAEDLISALREAGETSTAAELDGQLRETKVRRTKWKRMLEGRGIKAE